MAAGGVFYCMQFPYDNAEQLRQAARLAFSALGPDARTLHPDAQFSHLCIRSATDADFSTLKQLAAPLGTMTGDRQRQIMWVRLEPPINIDLGDRISGADRIGRLHFLELTSPKPDQTYPTGLQMLVCTRAVLAADEVEKIDSPGRPGWTLRFQRQGAAELSGL